MIFGETVSVSLRVFGEEDSYGNDAEIYEKPFDVEDVLIGRGDTVDVIVDGQPYAIKTDRRFCFPRGFSEEMRGALITHGGRTYKVVGDPIVCTEPNVPPGIRWNMICESVRFDG